MKYTPRFKQARLSLLLLPFSFALFLGICLWKTPSNQFHRANQQLFSQELCSNTINLHYTLANPRDYGIKDYTPTLPIYASANQQNGLSQLEESIAFYKNLDADRLSYEDALTLQLLLVYLEDSLVLGQYPYHQNPFSPSSGIHAQLPILLSEYTFRSTRDVEDYLSLLTQIGPYFDSLLIFETEKKEAGLLTAASSLFRSADHCRNLISAEDLASGEHFLQVTFRNRLEALSSHIQLSDNQIADYITRNDQILENMVLPAFQNLATTLETLADPAIPLQGLAAKPEGAVYYEALLSSQTGSTKNITNITSLFINGLQQEYSTLKTLLKNIDPHYLSEDILSSYTEVFPINTCQDILTDLNDRMVSLFPTFPKNADSTPSVHIKEVIPCLQEFCAPAFYLTPPVDDTLENTIYINTKNEIDPLELYTTLAHEGYPGHLYQTVYSNQLQSGQDSVPIRQILWFGGYLEGWALYVEFMAYDQAAQIMEECGYPEYAKLIQIEKHNRSTQLCLYSLLDIYIHHQNADLAQTADLLAQFGITDSASVNNIYQYIVEEPANYPKYYLGYLEILELKEYCKSQWQDRYSELAFHTFFLNYGPADFGSLHKLVATYTPATLPSSDPDSLDPTEGSLTSSPLLLPAR